MPISKSAKKALRVSVRKTSVNRHRKELIKAALKNVTAENVNSAVSMLDKSAKWGIFHPNKVARLKSRLAKTVGTPKAAKAKAEKPAKTAKPAAKTAPKTAKVTPAKKTATPKSAQK